MSIYANVNINEGFPFAKVVQIIDLGSHDPQNPAYIDLTGIDPQPQVDWFYEIATGLFYEIDPGYTEPKKTLTAPQLWMQRFTSTERAKVWALCNGESIPGVTVTLEQRYRAAAFRDITLAGEPIPLHNDEVITVITAFETIGLLDPGRATEILT